MYTMTNWEILLCNNLYFIGKNNFESLKVPVPCMWNLDLLERLLCDYDNKRLLEFLRYGFPIGQVKDSGCTAIPKNWKGAKNNHVSVQAYFKTEIENNAVLGPFRFNPFDHKAFLSPLNTRDKKDSLEKRIIVDMSFPRGTSVNDGIRKDWYLNKEITLSYPTVDSLVEIVRQKGKGCLLFKRDLRWFYRQIPVCPKEYSKLGCSFDGNLYFDKVLIMGCQSSCFIAQSITNAFQFILQKRGVACVNYLDDLGGADVPTSVRIACARICVKSLCPSMRMIFLGIVIDTVKLTLELDDDRLNSFQLLGSWEMKTHASLKEVQRLVGVLSFASSCIRQGRAFFSRILNFLRCIPLEGKAKIPDAVYKDILWWKNLAPLYNGISYIPATFWSRPDSWLSTDACLTGGGGYFNGFYFHFSFSHKLIAKAKYINQLELFVLWKVVELWASKMKHKNVLIYCDNKATVDCLHSCKSQCEFSQACIRNILFHCALNDLQIRAVHLEGRLNRLSDCLSRWDLDVKFQKEFYRLTENVDTYECVLENTEFIDLY